MEVKRLVCESMDASQKEICAPQVRHFRFSGPGSSGCASPQARCQYSFAPRAMPRARMARDLHFYVLTYTGNQASGFACRGNEFKKLRG